MPVLTVGQLASEPRFATHALHDSSSVLYGLDELCPALGMYHFCAGAWASRAMIADVALPTVFKRLGRLRLDGADTVEVVGWAFRGLRNLPARWDP